MLTPQECLDNFLNGKYLDENYKLLLPAYETLFKDIGNKIIISDDYRKNIKNLEEFFDYLNDLKNKNEINFIDNSTTNRDEIVQKFIGKIPEDKIIEAVKSLNEIIIFILKNRKNINGLDIILWSLFNITRIDQLKNDYKNKPGSIRDALLNFEFLSLIIEYDDFAEIAINDFLMPVELKNPKRRQGNFDKEIFEIIYNKLININNNLKFEKEISGKKMKENLCTEANWLITEKTIKKISFPLVPEGKFADMLCKLENKLFIGAHKEQQEGGGAQDNQARDASLIFKYPEEILKKIKSEYNIENIYLCLFLESETTKFSSRHWREVFEIVRDGKNKNKYILNSYQFIELIKSI